ncbi:FHA domain-containing protein [Bacteriovorax sp. Seq25_V]|uniref:FHA domain-containing protein n=1 Tax=Bacteriovorax sp. Seq25_V TaxID=1201288 RepID=UPI00038A37F8|nr:FHA domain-containing protein [Bacteriovorax sp. Seq25_V]EQC43263.1 hypothetical protein M900_0223 [Bacteriovorax sp. Seq25_V]
MINFSIIDSPDLLAIGKYEFKLHHIRIGRNLGNTIPINDPRIASRDSIILRTNKSGLLVESQSHLHLNAKKVSGSLQLKENDIITIGDTSIKIISFDTTNIILADAYYDKLEAIGNDDPKLSMLLEKIEEFYINLTNEGFDDLEK